MKQIKLLAILMALFTIGTVCSCGDDDEDNTAETLPSSQMKSIDGTPIRLTSLGYQSGNGKINSEYYVFQYDSNGKLLGFGSSEFTYTMEDNNFTASYGEEEETITGSIKFETNSKGFVTRITLDTQSKVYNGNWSKDKGTLNYNYDSDGQLLGLSGTGSTEGYNKNHGGNYSETSSGKATYTWTNGNLMKATREDSGTISADGASYPYKTSEAVNFTYGTEQNPLRQNPYWEIKGIDALDLIGIFGVGPVNLPTKSVAENSKYENGEFDYESVDETVYTFTLNSNGSLNTQTQTEKTVKSSWGGGGSGWNQTYYFGYNNSPTRSTNAESKQFKDIAQAICAQLFKTHRTNKK